MRKIRNRILKMRSGAEKEFLWDLACKIEKAIETNDNQKLEMLNERLNGLYDGLSEEAQGISQEIARKIMEVRNA